MKYSALFYDVRHYIYKIKYYILLFFGVRLDFGVCSHDFVVVVLR